MSLQKYTYFDNNATTRVFPEVVQAMLPFLQDHWGNPSSAYRFGHDVAHHLADARDKVARLIGADAREIVFTSGGTESNNAVLQSALAAQPGKRHLVLSAVEHSASLKYTEFLAQTGCALTLIGVDSEGAIDLGELERALRPETALVSIMWANNETGVIFPVAEIASLCRRKGVLFHTDAIQAVGKVPVDLRSVQADFLSLSAHKLHAPKGVGALYIRRNTPFQPLILGGQQERGRRGGTENVAGIVAFGRAAELAAASLDRMRTQVGDLRDQLEEALLKQIPGAQRNGAKAGRLPNTTNLAFEGVEAEAILIQLDRLGICASSGSACTTGALEPSHVLRAMGMSVARARGSIRFSLGLDTTQDEVEHVASSLPAIISRLRALSGLKLPPDSA